MDEHVERVCAPVLRTWADFVAGRATLLDISRVGQQAADALDNSRAPVPRLLAEDASDLEYAFHTKEAEDHLDVGRRLMQPVLARLRC